MHCGKNDTFVLTLLFLAPNFSGEFDMCKFRAFPFEKGLSVGLSPCHSMTLHHSHVLDGAELNYDNLHSTICNIVPP